jgi:hypothetical protein
VVGIKRGGWKGGVAERGGGWLTLVCEDILIGNRMAPTPHKETLLRRSTRVSSPAKDFIVVDTSPQSSTQAAKSTMIDNKIALTSYKETPLQRSTRVSSLAEDLSSLILLHN